MRAAREGGTCSRLGADAGFQAIVSGNMRASTARCCRIPGQPRRARQPRIFLNALDNHLNREALPERDTSARPVEHEVPAAPAHPVVVGGISISGSRSEMI